MWRKRNECWDSRRHCSCRNQFRESSQIVRLADSEGMHRSETFKPVKPVCNFPAPMRPCCNCHSEPTAKNLVVVSSRYNEVLRLLSMTPASFCAFQDTLERREEIGGLMRKFSEGFSLPS